MDGSLINSHDLIHLGATVGAFSATIATFKADIRWIKQWCADHKSDDEAAFKRQEADIRELRAEVRVGRSEG